MNSLELETLPIVHETLRERPAQEPVSHSGGRSVKQRWGRAPPRGAAGRGPRFSLCGCRSALPASALVVVRVPDGRRLLRSSRWGCLVQSPGLRVRYGWSSWLIVELVKGLTRMSKVGLESRWESPYWGEGEGNASLWEAGWAELWWVWWLLHDTSTARWFLLLWRAWRGTPTGVNPHFLFPNFDM